MVYWEIAPLTYITALLVNQHNINQAMTYFSKCFIVKYLVCNPYTEEMFLNLNDLHLISMFNSVGPNYINLIYEWKSYSRK